MKVLTLLAPVPGAYWGFVVVAVVIVVGVLLLLLINVILEVHSCNV